MGQGPQPTMYLWGLSTKYEWYGQCGACDGHTEGKVWNKEMARKTYGFAWNGDEELYMCAECNDLRYDIKQQLGHHCFLCFLHMATCPPHSCH